MLKTNKIFLIILFITIIFCPVVFSEGTGVSAGYLLIRPVGGRSLGLGDGFGAVTGDISALHYNPATVATIIEKQVLLMYNNSFAYDNFGVFDMCFFKKGIYLAGNLSYYNSGELEFYDSGFNLQKVTAEQDLILGLTIGLKPKEKMPIGITIKQFNSELVENKASTAYAADIGFMYLVNSNFTAGMSYQNYGKGIKYISEQEHLPEICRLSVTYNIQNFKDKCNILILGEGSYLIYDKMTFLSAGIELKFSNIGIRCGYKSDSYKNNFFSGLGYDTNKISIDYAVKLESNQELSHMVSMNYKY